MSSILVTYGTSEGQTAKVAKHIGAVLESEGVDVTVATAARATDLSVESFDGVLVGSPVHNRRHDPDVTEFVRRNRESLAARPSGFFQLSLASIMPLRWAQRGAREFVDRFVAETRWDPDRVGTFAGAVKYSQYDRRTRFTFRLVSAVTTGDTDTSRDYEYTDWEAVERFAREFAEFTERERPSTPAVSDRQRAAVLALVVLGFAAGYWWFQNRDGSGTVVSLDVEPTVESVGTAPG